MIIDLWICSTHTHSYFIRELDCLNAECCEEIIKLFKRNLKLRHIITELFNDPVGVIDLVGKHTTYTVEYILAHMYWLEFSGYITSDKFEYKLTTKGYLYLQTEGII